MTTLQTTITKLLFSSLLVAGLFAAAQSAAAADVAQVRVDNITAGTSLGSGDEDHAVFTDAGYANAKDTLYWQLSYLSLTSLSAASSFTITLPADVTYVAGSAVSSPGSTAVTALSTTVNGQQISFTFNAKTIAAIRFKTTVKPGNELSTTHIYSDIGFTTNGTPFNSNSNARLRIGPTLTSISPTSGTDKNGANVTLTGHGFAETGDSITSIKLNDNTNIVPGSTTITSIGSGLYTITGVRVPSGKAVQMYTVVLTISQNSKTLSTGTDSANTVQFTVQDGTAPLMAAAETYTHASGKLVLDFNEPIQAAAAVVSSITIYDAAAAGNSLVLTGATPAQGVTSDKLSITLTQSQINTVAGWQAAANLYVQLGASAVLDTAGNAIEAQVARTAVGTWNKDTVKPSITAFSITQGGSEVTSAKAGTITVSFTLSEVASTTPVISIDQPGETDISNTAPTGAGGNVYTYVYTVNASSTPQYLDGTATVIISGAQDYAGNTMDADSSHTFTIDTQVPDTAVSEPAIGDKSTSSVTLTWTPTYTAADFSTYKVYYGTSAGVTSSTGTEINKNTDGYSTLGASSTTGITVSGLSSSTSYYFVVYTCDTAGNCSPASAEITADTNSAGGGIVPSTSSGGGGGNSSSSAGSSFSVSKSITTAGGSVTMALDSESGITVTLAPNLLNTATTITISDATSAQKGSAPVSSSEGTLVGNTAYTISAISTGTSLTTLLAPAAVTMQYTNTQYGSDGEALRVAYFSISENKWIPLATTVNLAARTASVLTDRVGLFALINYVAAPVSEPESVPVDGSAPVDTGTVLGSSTGAYPNGSLLKAPGSSAVWYISNGEKHLITSAAVFQTRFNWNDIITLPSSLQLGLYQQGVDVQFGSGTLVKEAGNSAVFRIAANGQKQPIISADVFAARGYNFKNVLEVESGALDSYQTGTEIADAAVLDGDLVKRADSVAVYLVEDGMLRLIPHESVFNGYAFSFASVRTVEPAQLNAFERGSDLMYPDGTLVKGNASAVYVIADGKRRPIVSAYDFEALLYDWSKIVYVPEALLAAIDIASAIRLVQLDNTEGTVSAAVAQ